MDEINAGAIIDQLQAENEKLREKLAQFRLNPPRWWQSFNIHDVVDILQDNYFWLGAVAGVIVAIVYGLVPFFSRRSHER